MKRFRLFVTLFALSLAVSLMAAEGGAARGGRGGRGTGSRFGGGMMSRGFGGRGMSKMALTNNPQVQKELKITKAQLAKIKELQTAQRDEMRKLYSGMRDMSAEERTQAREKMAKKMEAAAKKAEKKLAKIINKDQDKRLNEMALQLQGANGLTSDYAVKGLKLSKDQVKKIKAALKASADETQKLMESMRGSFGRGRPRGDDAGERPERPNFQEIREKMTAIRKKGETNAMKVLTEAQKKGLEKLKGKKFELERGSRFGGRGGGRTRGGSAGGEGRSTGSRRRDRPEGEDDK